MSQAESWLRDRIIAILELRGLSVSKLSGLLGIGQSTLNNQVKEASKVLYSHIPDLLKLFPEISPDWLWHGKGPMLVKDITLPDGLREDEAMMLDYYRHCPKESQDALREAGAILSKHKVIEEKNRA